MIRRRLRICRAFAIFILFFLVAAIPMTATGHPEYKDSLPDQGVNYGCQYCHTSRNGGGPLNQFGIDFEENDLSYNDTLGNIDSDGDGFSNSHELHGKPVTNPGNPDSYPIEGSTQTSILIFLVAVVIAVVVGLIMIWRKR